MPLLQSHRVLGPVALALQEYLENTICLALRFGGAWRVDNSQVLFHVVGGRRARFAAHRGRRQPLDLELMADLGYLPWQVLSTMETAGRRFRTAHSVRGYNTPAELEDPRTKAKPQERKPQKAKRKAPSVGRPWRAVPLGFRVLPLFGQVNIRSGASPGNFVAWQPPSEWAL